MSFPSTFLSGFRDFFTQMEVLKCHVKIAGSVQGMTRTQSHFLAGYGDGI
jgi:hypothetical protein